MTRRAAFIAAVLIVAAGALAFRLPRLDLRPMHGDEAVEAFKTGLLLDHGTYRYDPEEYHGPTLHYATLPFLWLRGEGSFAETSEVGFRLLPVVCGVGLILVLLLVGDGLGRASAVCAGVLTAVSPAMVFYSRYYIHEMLLVLFSFVAIAAGWRYVWSKKVGWAILAGASLGLMHATKETCVFAYAAMALAVVGKLTWRRWWGYPIRLRAVARRPHIIAAAVAAAVVSVVLFTSLFTHWRGPLDSVLTYVHYLRRSGGAGLHEHPWHYYLEMLFYSAAQTRGPWWSEALILGLAVVGFVAVMWRESVPEASTPLARFVAFYTLFLTAIYAVVPYKTPWCMLGFLHGMILLAGIGVVVLVRLTPTHLLKGLVCLALAGAALHLGLKAHDASYRFHTDRRNPYVYAHTSGDVRNLVWQVEQLAEVHADGRRMVINVDAPENDWWPLPWYFRTFPHVGYPLPPEHMGKAAMHILHEGLEREAPAGFEFTGYFGLRPTVHVEIYARKELWEAFIKRQEEKTAGRAGPK